MHSTRMSPNHFQMIPMTAALADLRSSFLEPAVAFSQ
ncbi:hypothetical protein MANES_02G104950v8 [Manihot esculenta]|uniref:Uncharacterized protein n=1 Tax=Manihot esculenta TaxID=3983 RepID=A0ACB7I6Y1_MANES|nr:hypothetical protein MANES_02G104950v8 [Manihot esculenta]